MTTVPLRLLELTQRCLEDYGLKPVDTVLVGLSGGKDSTTLLLILRELGIDAIPAVVDLGYDSFDLKAVVRQAKRQGFRPVALDIRAMRSLTAYNKISEDDLRAELEALDSIQGVSPCGICSRLKRKVLLEEASKRGIGWVALGHQREDFLATMLKDYMVYNYYRSSGSYVRAQFERFVSEATIDFDQLDRLIREMKVSTMGVRLSLRGGIDIIRPLFYVAESDIEAFIHDSTVSIESSGCSHDIFVNEERVPITKREIVHHYLRLWLQQSPELADRLVLRSKRCLDARGRALSNPRSVRKKLLPGFCSTD